MVEIGAGGGSLAHVDGLGRIGVGPESAGADPGPACYGRGGRHPAVTDANLVLGRYDPQAFAGGTMQLQLDAATAALAAEIGHPLALEPGMAALGVIEMVDENMANAARVHAIESGKTYDRRTMIAFGGGGPVHGTRIAEKIGIDRVLIPKGAGVGSAIGFLRAPVGYEVVRSLYQRFRSFDLAAVNALLADMVTQAQAVVAQGSFGAATGQTRIAFMRYVGQGHEIAVTLPPRPLVEADVAAIRAAYDTEYSRFYDRPVPGSDVEILSYAVVVATKMTPVPASSVEAVASIASPRGHRAVRDTATGAVTEWALFDRAELPPGATLQGPAIIAEAETSTLVGPRWHARIDAAGDIDLIREPPP